MTYPVTGRSYAAVMAHEHAQAPRDEWVSFPGGELEGKRPKVLCPACREALKREAAGHARSSGGSRPLCFQCYRAQLDREKALRAARDVDTGSEERFQFQLPLETVDRPRLEMLMADRAAARTVASQGVGRFGDRRREAQIEARHALQAVAAGLKARQLAASDRERELALAIHAAELQLPESWLPFVVSR